LSALACATLLDNEAVGGITDDDVDEIFRDRIKNAGVPIAGNVAPLSATTTSFIAVLTEVEPGG
jgi:hypothetical protein